MPNYRPATAADVGRTDVEVNDAENHEWIGPRKLFAVEPGAFPFLAGDERGLIKCNWNLARVPILPEECSHEWESTREVVDGEQTAYCNKCGEEYTYGEMCEPDEPVRFDGAILTIRRKLEAGGLAEPEQAILLDGRYYPVDWVKSSPGVLPEQCEVV